MSDLSLRGRVLITVAAAVVLAIGAVGYAVAAREKAAPPVTSDSFSITPGPRLLVVRGRYLATVSADDPSRPAQQSAISCVRAYAAGGTGVCLRQDSMWTYSLHVLDSGLAETNSFDVRGLPNRARVSSSGRMVSWTAFISGESYNKGGFSTRTGILDTRTGDVAKSLETFAITRDGEPYQAADVNFWGVTFTADDNRFYATMATDGLRYLVQGDFASKTVRTITDNVECPSLSPDGTRIAFKQAIDDNPVNGWRLAVLDLETLQVTTLAEKRSIDDQPAWLSGDTIGYTFRDSDGTPSVWATSADGSGTPRLLVENAESPAGL
ncbi:MAG TPA: hypothetical protein VLI04_01810 [Nocardioidaceae bacterium]|nr:hypothetical protein [Nocardioidaceae bacterium]